MRFYVLWNKLACLPINIFHKIQQVWFESLAISAYFNQGTFLWRSFDVLHLKWLELCSEGIQILHCFSPNLILCEKVCMWSKQTHTIVLLQIFFLSLKFLGPLSFKNILNSSCTTRLPTMIIRCQNFLTLNSLTRMIWTNCITFIHSTFNFPN